MESACLSIYRDASLWDGKCLMTKHIPSRLLFFAALLPVFFGCNRLSLSHVDTDRDRIVVQPEPYERALRNPLKGFTGRDNEWSTLLHHYFAWNTLERDTTDGVERIREMTEERWADLSPGTKVIPRVYLHYPGRPLRWPTDLEENDFSSEDFTNRMIKLVENLGQVWNNDPRVAFVEMGIIGKWGEHHSPAPSLEMQEIMSEVFLRAFPDRQVSVRHPWRGFRPGKFGVYWDSWGHWQQMWAQGRLIAELNEDGYWKSNYIGGEVAYDWGLWEIQPGRTHTDTVALPVHREYMINSIRWLHGTQLRWISGYDRSVPEARAGGERIQKVLGYRFVIEKADFPRRIDAGAPFEVELTVRNEGAAPFYYDWPLELSLLDPETLQPVWRSTFEGVDIREWLPGSGWPAPEWRSIDVWPEWAGDWPEGSLAYANPPRLNSARSGFTAGVPDGEYILAVSILDPAGKAPAVRFATRNYLRGGRHPIGFLAVGEGESRPLPADFKFDDPYEDRSLGFELPDVVITPSFTFDIDHEEKRVSFDASASTIHGDRIAAFEWDLTDDGQVDATGPTVSHTFESGGTHFVRMTLVGRQGGRSTNTHVIKLEDLNPGRVANSPDDPARHP